MVPVPGPPASPGAGTGMKLRLRFGDWVFDSRQPRAAGAGGGGSPLAEGLRAPGRPPGGSAARPCPRPSCTTASGRAPSCATPASRASSRRSGGRCGDPVRRPGLPADRARLRLLPSAARPPTAPRHAGPGRPGVRASILAWGPRELFLAEGENLLGRAPGRLSRGSGLTTVSRRHARIVLAAADGHDRGPGEHERHVPQRAAADGPGDRSRTAMRSPWARCASCSEPSPRRTRTQHLPRTGDSDS